MKLRDMKIGTQLGLSLGLILILVILLGVQADRQADLLWQQTTTIYEHPFQVRRALGALNADILSLRLEFRNRLLAVNDSERLAAQQEADVSAADAERQFSILYDRYLGPRADIDEAHQAFVHWLAAHREIQSVRWTGPPRSILEFMGDSGEIGKRRNLLLSRFKKIDDFARSRADQIYRESTMEKDLLQWELFIAVAAILLLSFAVSYRLLRSIRTPLQELGAAAERFRSGNMAARSGYVSANEFGVLSAGFNSMAATVESDARLKEQAAEVSAVMLRHTEARPLYRELLGTLMRSTGSEIGAVYLVNTQRTMFEHVESIGLGAGRRGSFSATEPEGEFGTAVATGQIQRITAIPEGTRFLFETAGGDLAPREIITIPLSSGTEIVAVVSLASIRPYDVAAVQLVHSVSGAVSARTNGLLAQRRVRELVERLEQQNRELEAQARELAAQRDELAAQNTELEVQKRQIGEANRLKSAFLSKMSHELRTPLNSVIALSGVLNRRLASRIPEEEYGYLDVIERNGRHLLALINDILDLSRIEAGREEINPASFTLSTLVGEIVDILEPQAQAKGIALLNRVSGELPMVVSDPVKCRHILQNLVANAVKFTERGCVEIAAGRSGDELHVSVRDTGIGIPADQIPHIFDEFRQADDSASRKHGGTGLGLAIALKYARMLEGGIGVESTPGAGSTFTWRLPLRLSRSEGVAEAERPDGKDVPAVADRAPGPAVQGEGILLVEDSEPAIIQICDILAQNGYRVRTARSGKEALAQIESCPPVAVILDLMMPEMDGFAVLRAIRGMEAGVHLPVLILTAKHASREELSFLEGNHIYQLIQKGDVSKSELLAAVAAMVARQPEVADPRRLATRPQHVDKPLALVVDGDADSVGTMRVLLEDTCAVLAASNGQTALELARRHRPDLVLTELALPEMDGLALLAELRRDTALSRVPVVAATSSAMKGDRERILAHGFDAYISKPIEQDILRNIVREVLHGRGQMEDSGD